MTGEEVSKQTATRDLTEMVNLGLLAPVGERRARHYVAGEETREAWREIRERRPPREADDPFRIVGDRRQPTLT